VLHPIFNSIPMAGKSRTGTITLETVIKRFETLDAILVKLEASVSKNNKDQSNQATIREAEIEERVLRSVMIKLM
jgi:hypothetical protein